MIGFREKKRTKMYPYKYESCRRKRGTISYFNTKLALQP